MSVRLVTKMKMCFFVNFSFPKCPSFPDPQPASLGPCYALLGLGQPFVCIHIPQGGFKATTSSFFFFPPVFFSPQT